MIQQKQAAALLETKNRAFDGKSSLMSMFRNSVNKHHVPNNVFRDIAFSERFSVTPDGLRRTKYECVRKRTQIAKHK